MALFKELIQPSQTVIEIGGHIGYITQYYSQLVGPQGVVYVFEPGRNNLGYLKQNISNLTNVHLVEKAVSNSDGKAIFYLDDLTGQNNSILPDYDVLIANQKNSYVSSNVTQLEVETIQLDTFLDQEKVSPDMVKIDIEGAELLALKGMFKTCHAICPVIMVEVTNNNQEVRTLLNDWNYVLFNDQRRELLPTDAITGNVFCFHENTHSQLIKQMRSEGK